MTLKDEYHFLDDCVSVLIIVLISSLKRPKKLYLFTICGFGSMLVARM